MRNAEEIRRLVDAHQNEFIALSDRVREIPELCHGWTARGGPGEAPDRSALVQSPRRLL